MKLTELQNWTVEELDADIKKGGEFVIFTYTISIVIMTFRRPSDIYYIKSNEFTIFHGWLYLILSLLFGWWGIPYGPIYTIQSIWYSFLGKNVTDDIKYDVMQQMNFGNPTNYDTEKLMEI